MKTPGAPVVAPSPRRLLWLALLALLVACGGRAGNAPGAGPATGTLAQPPSPTSRASAAATPTPSRPAIAGGAAVTERTGRCRVTVPGGFTEEPPRSGTFVSRDRLAFAGLEALDAAGAPFETVVGSAIAGVQGLVTGYQETGAAREQDALRVDFTGALGGRPGRGMVYFRQFGPTICQSTLIVADGSSVAYDAALRALTATLAANSAAAAPWPTPTAPRAPTAAPAAGAARAIRYLAMGDSYAYGTGASDPATRGYAARFADYLRRRAGATVTTTNLAAPGATSADLLGDYPARGRASQSQLGQGVRLLAEGAGDRADVVTIAIGGNDILRLLRPGQVCAGEAITGDPCLAAMQESVRTLSAPNLPRILEALVDAAGSGTQILVLTYPNAFSVGAGDLREQRTDLAIATLNGVIADAVAQLQPRAAGRGVRLATVDLFPLFAGRAGTLTHILGNPPDIHPTDEGYAVIAEALARAYQASGVRRRASGVTASSPDASR